MLDPTNDLVPTPSSPTISSISSSDLDTESTESFFHDRSTTLGTLMGVSFPAITFRAASQRRDPHSNSHPSGTAAGAGVSTGGPRRKAKSKKKKNRMNAMAVDTAAVVAERRRRWWQLCREEDARPASLGEFLEVERKFGDGVFYGTPAEHEGMVVSQQRNNSVRVLFSDGRVLPPSDADEGGSTSGNLCNRFPVSITGICSGGVG